MKKKKSLILQNGNVQETSVLQLSAYNKLYRQKERQIKDKKLFEVTTKDVPDEQIVLFS
jgi:hypothetical protein